MLGAPASQDLNSHMTSVAISVVVIEDDAPLRDEFERMARSHAGLKLLGSAGTLAEARALLARYTPDVMMVDLGLPDGDGIELITTLGQISPQAVALVTTVFGDESHVIRAIEAGARGYLLKDSSVDEFARAVQIVHQGGSPLSPQIARHLLARFAPAARPPRVTGPDALTPREIDILTRISQGFTVAETAEQLNISAHTAATHIKNAYSKLAVRNRVEAVNQARRRGLIG